jgi:capsular exopolysaccharide synthesis family protein
MTYPVEAQKLMSLDAAAKSDGDAITVGQMFSTFWRRRIVLLSVTFAITVLGFVVLKLLTQTYTSTAIVVLSTRQDGVVNMEESFMNAQPSDPVIRSEVDALQSRSLIDRVIDREHLMQDPEFNLYARPFNPNPFICVPGFFLPGFLKVDLGCKPRDSSLLSPAQLKYNVGTQVLNAYTVTPDAKTYSVKIAFTSVDPVKAARITNTFADEYMRSQVDEQIAASKQAATELNPRLAELSAEVARADRAVEQFKEQNHIVDLPDQPGQFNTLALQEVQNLTSELSAARTTKAQLEAAQQEVQRLATDPSQTLSAPAVAAAPLVENLRIQEATAAAQLASLQGTYGPQHPLVVSAKNQVDQLRQKLAEEAQRAVKQLAVQTKQAEASEQQLQASMDQLTSVRTSENRVSPELRQLESAQTAAKTVYDAFVRGIYQASSDNGNPTARGRVVQHADIVDWPTFPNIPLFMAVIFVAAVMIAIGVVYALETGDKSFHSADSLEEIVGLPVLGMGLLAAKASRQKADVPQLASTVSRRMVLEPTSALSESVRLARTAIAGSRSDRLPKIVMLTSAVPGEGKTTFALMMARQSASTGSRVVLIEAEMRRPAFSRDLRPMPPKGLSDYLTGHAALDEIIGIDSASGTHFIGSGEATSRPSELLASPRMATLLRDLGTQYDLIILDTPPASIVADALQLSSVVDAAILLVKWASTPRHLVMDAVKKLRAAKAPLVGMVMTQVDSRKYKFYGQGTLPHDYARSYYTEA